MLPLPQIVHDEKWCEKKKNLTLSYREDKPPPRQREVALHPHREVQEHRPYYKRLDRHGNSFGERVSDGMQRERRFTDGQHTEKSGQAPLD